MSKSPPKLVVMQDANGEICCHREGDTGMFIVGRGATFLEAVGSWTLYSQVVEARAELPELLDQRFAIHPQENVAKRAYTRPPRRSD